MADGAERPSLRVLYNQGERDEFFKRTMPKPPNVDIEDFRIGLKADVANMELVETMVQVGFEKSGLTDFDALDDPDALIRLNATVLDLVKSLSEIPTLSEAPEWWTSMWCQYVVEFLWKQRQDELAKQRKEIRRGKQVKPATESVTPAGLGIPVPPVVTLQNMTFELAFESNEKGSPVVMEELAATRCLRPGKPGHQASSYGLQEFIRQFELISNKSRDTPIRLIYGSLGYYNKLGQLKPISKQQNFEVALLSLFNNRGEEFTLKFVHCEETFVEKNNRFATEAAKLRVHQKTSRKAGVPKNKSYLLATPDPGRGRTVASSSKLSSSSPPHPPSHGPLPAIPAMTPKALAVYNSPERVAERAAERAKILIRNKSRSASWIRAQQLAARELNLPSSAGPDKPLPPVPANRIPTGPPVKPARNNAPPPISIAATKAWRTDNKLNPPLGQGSRTAPPPASSPTSKTEIKRGRTGRAGLHAPSDDGIEEQKKRSLAPVSPPRTSSLGPKTSERVVPHPDPVSHFSDSEENEIESLSGDPIDQTSPRKTPRKPYRDSLTLKENLLENFAVPIGHGIQIAGRRVSRLISLASPKPTGTPGKGSVEYYPDQRRLSLSSKITRVATAVGDKKLVVKPAVKKTLGIVKIPTPQLTSKNDGFELRDAKYKTNFEIIAKQTYRRGGDEYVDDQAEHFKGVEKQLEAGEVDDRDADLDEDEAPKTPGDYMIEQLQKMQNMPELAQMYDHGFTHPFPENFAPPQEFSRWKECCQLFQLDPSKTSVDERVTLAGLKTPLYLYQAFGVYWQVKTSRMIGGGFVGDEMGLGKTLSFLAYIVVERQLAKLWEEVRKWRSRELKAMTHLEAEQCGAGAVCPRSRRRGPGSGWIACPCASPMSAALPPKAGVRLAILPPALVPTWVEQWDTHIDESNEDLCMRLIIAHDGTNKSLVSGQLDVRDGRNGWSERNLKSNRMAYSSRTHTEGTEWFTDVAQHTQERLLVVTTKEHWQKTWSRKFEHDRAVIWSFENTELGEMMGGKAPGIVYGIAMIDECHEDWQKGKGRSGVLASLPRSGRPFVWGYSGTPITTTPRCIEGVLWAIEILWPKNHGKEVRKQTGLEQHPELWQFSWQRLNAICKEFQDHVNGNKGSPILFKDFYQRFKPFLTMLMLRRTADTPWFGQPIIKLPPHTHEDIFLKHNTQFDEKIEQFGWAPELNVKEKLAALHLDLIERNPRRDRSTLPQKFTFNAEMRIYWKMRIIATFPYLVTMGAVKHPQHLDLTVEELKKFRGKDEKTNRNPYYHKLQQIVEHSPKMMWLYNFLTELDKTKDINGEEQKVVIMSEFHQVTFIIKLFLEKFLRGKSRRACLIYPGLKPPARKAMIEAFTDAKDEKGNRKQSANYQYLIGTTRIIGSGLQLTRACNVVMMEPDYEFYRELQGYARVHRIGQKNPGSRSYRLLDAGNPWEKKILMRQAERGEFPGRQDTEEESPTRYGNATELVDRYGEPGLQNGEDGGNEHVYDEDEYGNEEEDEVEGYVTDMLTSFPEPGERLSCDYEHPLD